MICSSVSTKSKPSSTLLEAVRRKDDDLRATNFPLSSTASSPQRDTFQHSVSSFSTKLRILDQVHHPGA